MERLSRRDLEIIQEDIDKIVSDVGQPIMHLSGKTLLLTGAAGFLPSYLVDTIGYLNDNVFRVPCRLLALERSPVKLRERLGHLLGKPWVRFMVQDVLAPIILDEPVHYIVHAASWASPKDYLAQPIDTMDTNVVGTRNLLELARVQPVESFLFFSSGVIYGDPPIDCTQIPETYPGNVPCTGPRACYTESKRYGETLCFTFWREYQLPVRIVRPFYIYGPRLQLNDGRAIADFIANRLLAEPIRVLSDGRGIRAFCYISDATVGFWKVLLSDYNGEAFNIGNNEYPVSIRQLAEMVANLYEPHLAVIMETDRRTQHRQSTPSRVCPDLSKIRQMLGYQAKVSLRDGLLRTVEWHKAQLEVSD